jgi:hypothetical protein
VPVGRAGEEFAPDLPGPDRLPEAEPEFWVGGFVDELGEGRRDEEGDRRAGEDQQATVDRGGQLGAVAEAGDRRPGDEEVQRQGADEDEDEGEGEPLGQRFTDRGQRVVGLRLATRTGEAPPGATWKAKPPLWPPACQTAE